MQLNSKMEDNFLSKLLPKFCALRNYHLIKEENQTEYLNFTETHFYFREIKFNAAGCQVEYISIKKCPEKLLGAIYICHTICYLINKNGVKLHTHFHQEAKN